MAEPHPTDQTDPVSDEAPAGEGRPSVGPSGARPGDGDGMVGLHSSLVSLATLAGRRRREAQEALLERVASLLLQSQGPSGTEIQLIDDILLELIRDVELIVRARLADSLATVSEPPPKLLEWLLEDEAEVASPLILSSPAVEGERLIRACGKSHGHRLAVAQRPGIAREICDLLVESQEEDVALALLRNKTAAISQMAFARLTASLGHKQDIATALTERPDLSAALAHHLFWLVAGTLRTRILARFSVTPDRIDPVLQALADDGYAGLRPVFDEQAELGMDRAGRFGPVTALVNALRAGNLPEFCVGAARRLSIRPQTIARILKDADGEAFAVLGKALDLDRNQFTSLMLTLEFRRSGEARQVSHLDRVLQIFQRLERERAIATLSLWDRVELKPA